MEGRGILEPHRKAGNQVGSRSPLRRSLSLETRDKQPVAHSGRVGSNPTPGAKQKL